MKETNFLQEGFRKPELEKPDPYYYVCGGRYTYEELDKMTWEEFGLRRHGSIPSKLYKYYSNKVIGGRNYSKESLENNTVYLQEIKKFDDNYDCTLSINIEEFARLRIMHYAKICGMEINEKWDYNRYVAEFSSFLYNKMRGGTDLERIFGIKQLSTQEDYRRNIFCLTLKTVFLSCKEQDNIWQTAFYKAISDEYADITNMMNRFRVACFTTSPYMINMWSNQYADNNQGFCIEYEIPDLSRRTDELCNNLFPVIYSDARTDVLDKCLEYNERKPDAEYLSVIYKYGALAKSKSMWKSQDEWRLISYDKMLADNYNCKFYPITRVYLGVNMNNAQRREIIDICKRRGIPCVGVVRNNERYQMMDCEKMCEECIK